MNKLYKCSMALVALLWVTTAAPMFKVFGRKLRQPQKLDKIEEDIKKKYHSNKHNCTEVKQAVQALLEQKKKESNSDSPLGSTVLKIISDPSDDLTGNSIVSSEGPPVVELNLSKFPTSNSVVSTAAHEFVHIDCEHGRKKVVYDGILEHFNYAKRAKAAEMMSKCHEIEADSRSVIDQRGGSSRVVLNSERIEGAREYLKHAYSADREFHVKMCALMQLRAGRLGIDVEENVSRTHPSDRERLKNFDKLERLAQKQGDNFSRRHIDGHIAENEYCQEMAKFIDVATKLILDDQKQRMA